MVYISILPGPIPELFKDTLVKAFEDYCKYRIGGEFAIEEKEGEIKLYCRTKLPVAIHAALTHEDYFGAFVLGFERTGSGESFLITVPERSDWVLKMSGKDIGNVVGRINKEKEETTKPLSDFEIFTGAKEVVLKIDNKNREIELVVLP